MRNRTFPGPELMDTPNDNVKNDEFKLDVKDATLNHIDDRLPLIP